MVVCSVMFLVIGVSGGEDSLEGVRGVNAWKS